MKKLLIAGAALAALIGTPALAADMPLKAPPAPVAPAWSWTGFYVGLNGGYGWNKSTGDSFCINPAGALGGIGCDTGVTGVVRPHGGLFGGQIGYNWQSNSIVYGLETDIQWSGIKGTASAVDLCCNGIPGPAGIVTATSNLQWFGTFRGRLGVLASPNALLYVTGGLIYGHETVSNVLLFPSGFNYPAAASSTRAGGTVGGGLEYAFTPTFSGKVEGLWYDMGHLSDTFTCPAGALTCAPGYTEGAKYNFSGAIVRGGLNWHFNLGGGPVAARY
jgi:outer membrane immunogenic protein